ncbi:MAG: sigma-54 dependent transcriptional regulator [Deltaproteobacteria bacterium]|nr:sigma-54 dependent transcriptional regulator [Deltaproteobacteria bacterium]
MGKILIIDDDRTNSDLLYDMIRSLGHEVACAYTAEEGIQRVRSYPCDVVFLDIQLPDGNGLTLLPEIQRGLSAPEVIIITGYASPEGAELAIINGAWDFIEKPLVRKLIELPLLRALQYREAKAGLKANLRLRREGIVGRSPALEECLEQVAQAAASDTPVIITGETGTGKELFARAIHVNSARSGGTFAIVDCAALPPTIIESILFGHEKGAFTGADRAQTGLVQQADGGTLFLDEIGELPYAVQKTFLRVLQERCFRPVGGRREIRSDFRLIAATNRDLPRMAREGAFREDLLFRMQAYAIVLPPLRRHPADIEEIAGHYVHRICLRNKAALKSFSPEFLQVLTAYDWPGNIRELVNALESALATAYREPVLYPKHLPVHIRSRLAGKAVRKKETGALPEGHLPTLRERREAAIDREERQYLRELMACTGGDIAESCRISGLSRVRLYVLLKKYGIGRKDGAAVSQDENGFAARNNCG